MNGTDPAFQLESRLTSHGCYLQSFERDDEVDVYRIEYQSMAGDQTGSIPPREAGRVVNVLRDLFAERDWDVRGVEATVTDLDDEPLAEWRVDPAWMEALVDGELSEEEFSRRVVETLEEA